MCLSAVIPTIGRPSELPRTMQTLRQHAGPWIAEVVVVCNGLPDALYGIEGLHGMVVLKLGPTPSVWAARNAGARVASSCWLAFLDDDVQISRSWASAFAMAASEGWRAATGPVRARSSTPLSRARDLRNRRRYAGVTCGTPVEFLAAGNCIVRRDAFLAAGGFPDGGTGSDNRLARSLSEQGNPCCFSPLLDVVHEHDRGYRAAFANAWRSGADQCDRLQDVGVPAVRFREAEFWAPSALNVMMWSARLCGHVMTPRCAPTSAADPVLAPASSA